MSNIIIPLRYSPLLLTWLALIHAGAILCLVPISMPLSLHGCLLLGIGLSFCYGAKRQQRLCRFQQLEWRVDSQAWFLSDSERQYECRITLKTDCWLTEHFLLLPFFAKELSGNISLLFAFDQYSRFELKQLRLAVLQHQQFLKQIST